jgi:hypothetical protein
MTRGFGTMDGEEGGDRGTAGERSRRAICLGGGDGERGRDAHSAALTIMSISWQPINPNPKCAGLPFINHCIYYTGIICIYQWPRAINAKEERWDHRKRKQDVLQEGSSIFIL